MVVEIVRGLGLGGAESLLLNRLEYEAFSGTRRTTRVVNTHSDEDYLSGRVAATGVEVDDLGTSSRWRSAARLWRIARHFSFNEPVVVHSPWPAAVLKLRCALGARSPRLVEVAHSTSYALPTRILGKLLNRFADGCVAVSAEVAKSTSGAGFRDKTVIHAGVDRLKMREWIAKHPDAWRNFRASLGLEADTRLVVSVGNLYEDKRHRLLIDTLEILPGDTHVVIVGEGPCRGALEAQIDRAHLSNRVHLLGRRSDAWQWMAVADLVAHPSAREGLPIALVEARVLGVPTIAFDVGGVSSVLFGALSSAVVPTEKPEYFQESLVNILVAEESGAEAYPHRAAEASVWDIGRYSEEFYLYVMGGE